MRTRNAQIAPNLIQEIDRIAQIVRTNEPSFSSARLFIISHTNRVDSADAEKDFRESTVRISDCRASSILKSVPVSQDSASAENLSKLIQNLSLESLGISEQTLNPLVRFRS